MESVADSGESRLAELVHEALLEAGQQLARARKGRDRGVHKARKALQRLRSLLRFLRPVAGGQARKAEHRVRDLRRLLAELRDAKARCDLLARLARTKRWAPDADRIAQLVARESAILRRTWQRHPREAEYWDDIERRFARLQAGLPELPWSKVDGPSLEAAIARAWNTLEARMRKDRGDCEHEARHAVRCALRRYATLSSLAAQLRDEPHPVVYTLLARRCGREGDLWMAAQSARGRGRGASRDVGRLRLAQALEHERIALCGRNRRALARLAASRV